MNTMVELTCPSPAPLSPTATVRSTFAQIGTASAAGEEAPGGDPPDAAAADPTAGGNGGLAVLTEIAVAVELTAEGAAKELQPATRAHAASTRLPATVRAERSIARTLPHMASWAFVRFV
ncbi:MAG TPA: hypothetical protein VMV41_16355 [Cellulomonadaceae bacterium]|nr:hypothetical protein [Cellulomonadaceae bacterium]